MPHLRKAPQPLALILKIAVNRRLRQPNPAARLRHMHDELMQAYGPQHWWPARTPFEVILGAYLTQNTAWNAVERSLANLREAGALMPAGLRALPLARLRRLIRPSGFFKRKAPALKAFVTMLYKEFGGSIEALAATSTPVLRRRLLALSGVGPETAERDACRIEHYLSKETMDKIAQRMEGPAQGDKP